MPTIKQITDAAKIAAAEYPIKNVTLFGSYANGTATSDSDVDLLIEFETRSVSLITLCGIKNRMEELLQTSVDVVHSPVPEGSILEIDKVVPLYAA